MRTDRFVGSADDQTVTTLRGLAVGALRRMYSPEQGLFAFRIRRDRTGDVVEGVSRRYTATVLIGLADQSDQVQSAILGQATPQDVCGRLLADVEDVDDLGEVALTLWAARVLDHRHACKALDRLRALDPLNVVCRTVELAWLLTVLVVPGSAVTDESLAQSLAHRLKASFNAESGLFDHWPAGTSSPGALGTLSYYRRSTANWARHGAQPKFLHGHITCFADMVYPILAMSHYYQATKDDEARDMACRCAQRMCELQGPAGQWWWHYDVRTARVVEGYPVYAVHQDAMAPMALFALKQACGVDHGESIVRGLDWLMSPPESSRSLVDAESGVIWRKVARYEPARLARGLQALASSLHRSLRVPGLNTVLRPGRIEYESRSYHMGWILYAWPEDRVFPRVEDGR